MEIFLQLCERNKYMQMSEKFAVYFFLHIQYSIRIFFSVLQFLATYFKLSGLSILEEIKLRAISMLIEFQIESILK